MMLLIDIGNTAVKWALQQSGELLESGRFVHRKQGITVACDAPWGSLPQPARIVVANVAGDAIAAGLTDWTDAHWSLLPEFVHTAAAACGVTNAYDVATDLGVDRWAALIAAHRYIEGAVCVIDCGSAITVDLLSAQGLHLGGLILPGITMLKGVLLNDTANVLSSHGEHPASPTARGTGAGVHGGAVYMAAAAIERIINDYVAVQDDALALVITGGDAGELLTLLPRRVRHEPELVLKGLALLAGES